MSFNDLFSQHFLLLPSAEIALITVGHIFAFPFIINEPPCAATSRKYVFLKYPRSPMSRVLPSVCAEGRYCASLSVSGVSTMQLGCSVSKSSVTCNSTAAGLTRVKRPGQYSLRLGFSAKDVPSCNSICSKQAKGLSSEKCNAEQARCSINRSQIRRIKSGNCLLASWLWNGLY